MGITLKQLTDTVSQIKDYILHKTHKIDEISYTQNIVNSELDYGIFEPVARSSTFVACASVKYGNLSIDSDGYIILNANKKYNVFVDLYNSVTTTGMWLVNKEGQQVSIGKSTGSLGLLNIETSEETHVAIKFNLGASLETEWCDIVVQEVGHAIVIDPVEYVNTTHGIEDIPVGFTLTHTGTISPKHYLTCDGTEHNIADYPYLAQYITETYGAVNYFGGDGVSTFCVPNETIKYIDITPIMTNNNVPAPYIVSADSEHNNQKAFLAFNGTANSADDSWASQNIVSWLKIDFGTVVSVSKFAITGVLTNVQYTIKDFTLLGSNNDSKYDLLYEAKNQINWGSAEKREYKLNNIANYRYFKLEISSNNGAAYSALSLLHFYSEDLEKKYIKYEPTYFMQIQRNNTNYLMPTLYSEEERIIGSWINGKPLYEKTIISDMPQVKISGTEVNLEINVSNLYIDTLVSNTGFILSETNTSIPLNTPIKVNTNLLSASTFLSNNILTIRCDNVEWNNRVAYITIQYTKTTDAENSFTTDMIKDYIVNNNSSNNNGPSYGTNHYTDEQIINAIDEIW